MKSTTVSVRWGGDSLFPRVLQLVTLARRFRSTVRLKVNGEIADLRRNSVITIVALCAMANNAIEVEVSGEDEQAAARTVEQVLRAP